MKLMIATSALFEEVGVIILESRWGRIEGRCDEKLLSLFLHSGEESFICMHGYIDGETENTYLTIFYLSLKGRIDI